MDNPNSVTSSGSLLRELFHTGIYKRNQGKYARSLTGIAIFIVFALSAWRLSTSFSGGTASFEKLGLPSLLTLLGAWIAYRAVNWPSFADFLISVEAEMAKVSWPTRTELVRSVIVVIVLMVLLILFLFFASMASVFLLQKLGVIAQ